MKTVSKVTIIALLWVIVINSGILTLDTARRLHMAHAWWTGIAEVAPNYQPKNWEDIEAGVKGVGGKRYLAYDPGQSLLMLPGDWLGTQMHQFFQNVPAKTLRYRVVNLLIFIPLNVAVVVCCFWLLRVFGFQEKIAGLSSITCLLGTTILHYAQVHQQNNQVLLFVIIGYAAALACARYRHPRLPIFSGLALGAALLIRSSSIIYVFTVLLFLIGCIAYQSRDWLQVLKQLGLWLLGFMPLFLLGRTFDYIRYGSFLTTGQSLSAKQLNTDPIWLGFPALPANYPFLNEPQVGILGVLFSPAKSIFIYDPLLLPCLLLGIVFWKKLSPYIQWYLVTGIFNLTLHIVLTSRLHFWHGDWAWGARYHVTSVQLLLIPLIALFIQCLLSAKKVTVWLMKLILTTAIIVQIASVTMPYELEITQEMAQPRIGLSPLRFSYDSNLDFRLGQRLINIACAIDSSLFKRCINKASLEKISPEKRQFLKLYNHISFLPFAVMQKPTGKPASFQVKLILFAVWGLVLSLAIYTTYRWLFESLRKSAKFH